MICTGGYVIKRAVYPYEESSIYDFGPSFGVVTNFKLADEYLFAIVSH